MLRLVLWSFLGTLVLLVVAGALPASIKNLPTKLLFLLLGWTGWRRMRGATEAPLLPEVRRSSVPMAVLAASNLAASQACALVVIVPLVMLGARVTPPKPETLTIGAVLLSWLINVALTVPGEELLFRGAVLPALRPWGDRFAITTSAVLFAVSHVGFASAFFWALLLGLLTGIARVRAESLIPGMVLHGLGNTLGVAMSFSRPLNERMASWLTQGPGFSTIAGAAIVLVAWWGLVALVLRWLSWRWPPRQSPALPLRHLWTASSVTLGLFYVIVNVALTASMFRSAQP